MAIKRLAHKHPGHSSLALIFAAALFWIHPVHAQFGAAPKTAAPVCPSGTRLCSGAFGSQCYSPAAGQSCKGGAVCGAGQEICAGHYGSSCYSPAQGQQCLQGVICQSGQSICTAGGIPHCYSPASGEHCQ